MVSYHTTAISYLFYNTNYFRYFAVFNTNKQNREETYKLIASSLIIYLSIIAIYYLFEIIVNSAFNLMSDTILKLQHFNKTIDLKTL